MHLHAHIPKSIYKDEKINNLEFIREMQIFKLNVISYPHKAMNKIPFS